MSSVNEAKPDQLLGFNTSTRVADAIKPKKKYGMSILWLRLIAFSALAIATLLMALNKETKTLVVANIGNVPLTATLTAKLQHTPAFVFFVIANGMASVHNLVMIAMDILGGKFDDKGLRFVLIPILDMLTVALASAGDGAATFMAELGRNGNSHARWNKICDRFEAYCNRGGGALIASFVGIILLLIITVMSITKLPKLISSNISLNGTP